MSLPGRFEHVGFQGLDAILDRVHLGPVVIDDAIDDAMEHGGRTFGERAAVPEAERLNLLDRPRLIEMDGDEEVAAEEKIDVARLEAGVADAADDAVENQVQDAVIRFDLGMMHLGEGILDCKLVQTETHRAAAGVPALLPP